MSSVMICSHSLRSSSLKCPLAARVANKGRSMSREMASSSCISWRGTRPVSMRISFTLPSGDSPFTRTPVRLPWEMKSSAFSLFRSQIEHAGLPLLQQQLQHVRQGEILEFARKDHRAVSRSRAIWAGSTSFTSTRVRNCFRLNTP